MENLILKFRERSLRSWILIALCVTVAGVASAVISESGSGVLISIVLTQLSIMMLLSSLAAYAIMNINKAKVSVSMIVIGVVIALIGIMYTVSDISKLFGDMSDFLAYADTYVISSFIVRDTSAFYIFEYLIFILVFCIGFTSLNKRYVSVWIFFMVAIFFSFIDVILLRREVFSYTEYATFNMISSAIFLLGLIIALVVGRKYNVEMTSEEHIGVHVSQSVLSDNRDSESFASKVESLIQLKSLLDNGVLNYEEFEQQKRIILGGESNQPIASRHDTEKTTIIIPSEYENSLTSNKLLETNNKTGNYIVWFIIGIAVLAVVIILIATAPEVGSYEDSYETNQVELLEYSTEEDEEAPADCYEIY